MKRCCIAFAAVALAAASMEAVADTLLLENGSSFSGALQSIDEQVVVFRTSLAGTMMTPLDEVQAIATDALFAFEMNQSPARTGRLTIHKGTTRLVAEDLNEPFPLQEVASATPVAPPERESPPLDVQFETGLLWQSSDDDSQPFAEIRIAGGGNANRFSSRLLTSAPESGDAPDWFRVRTSWEGDGNLSLKPQVELLVERDRDDYLDLGADFDLSLGRTLFERESSVIAGDAGISARIARYDWRRELSPLKYRLTPGEGRGQDDALSLRLHLELLRELFAVAELSEDLWLYPSLTEFGDFRARSESALTFSLSPSLDLKLQVLLDYDDEPEWSEVERLRTSVGASLIWGF